MSDLGLLQRDFLDYIIREKDSDNLKTNIKSSNINYLSRLDIYKNNYIINITKSLELIYPITEKLISERYFQHLCHNFIKIHYPKTSCLIYYGQEFVDYLKTQDAMKKYAFVFDIAYFEWLKHYIYYAHVDNILNISDLMNIPENEHDNIKFVMNEHVKFFKSNYNVIEISKLNDDSNFDNIIVEKQSYILIYRYNYEIFVEDISEQEYLFLESLANNQSFLQAANNAKLDEDQQKLTNYLVRHFKMGSFREIY